MLFLRNPFRQSLFEHFHCSFICFGVDCGTLLQRKTLFYTFQKFTFWSCVHSQFAGHFRWLTLMLRSINKFSDFQLFEISYFAVVIERTRLSVSNSSHLNAESLSVYCSFGDIITMKQICDIFFPISLCFRRQMPMTVPSSFWDLILPELSRNIYLE